jgi:hypothetical protein
MKLDGILHYFLALNFTLRVVMPHINGSHRNMSSRFEPRRIGLATAMPRGRAMSIPLSGTGGGGEFGAVIQDEDRTFSVTREPVAHRIVFTVAHDIFDHWFQLYMEGKEQDKTFDLKVQQELTRIKAKPELMRMSVFERAYGWAILVLGYADTAERLLEPVTNPQALQDVKAYGPCQIQKVEEVTISADKRYGLPLYYYIKQAGLATPLKIHYSRVIHFASRLLDHDWRGMSTLDPVWDDLVTLRNIRWGMGQTMYRYGHGFPDLTFTGAEKADIDAWTEEGYFSNLSARTYFAHNESQTIEFKGMAGKALDPMNYYLPIMENISAGSGIPLAILRGVQAGTLTGSEVNQQEYFALIGDEETYYETGIRELIKAIPNLVGEGEQQFKFKWMGGFQLDDLKQAQIDQVKAQTLQVKGDWMTRNELRALQDPSLPKLSKEQGGEELLSKGQQNLWGPNKMQGEKAPPPREPDTNLNK